MRIFKNKSFARFAKKSNISDRSLCKAVADVEAGLIDADLGGGVIKQRIARTGSGKSGGFRTIILFKKGDLAFFVHGFAKNVKDNISDDELSAFKRFAEEILNYVDKDIKHAISEQEIIEVVYEKKTVSQ